MTIDEIKEILRIFNESGVGELELERGPDRLRIKKQVSEPPAPVAPAAPVVSPPVDTSSGAKTTTAAAEEILVKSPIVGTFYESSSPESAPFVKVGDAVEPGQVLCIIESMKLMNEIEAEVAGVIAAKLVENGRPVEYGEALYSIRPR